MRLTTNVANVEGAKRTIQRRVSADWRRHRTLARYLEGNLQRQWDGIRRCDLAFLPPKQRDYPKPAALVQSLPCREVPYCFRCAQRETGRRVQKAFDALHACKPAGKPPLMVHMVQTAPLTGDGWGWGADAAHDVDRFFRVVWGSLVDFFGEGIGGVLTYQDFGSFGPHKTHPHIDLTINGWRVLDGKASQIRSPDLRHGDRERWQRIVSDHARVFGDSHERNPGSVFFGRRHDSFQSYYGIMAYQLRELWDFSAITNPAPRVLRWHSYKGGFRDYGEGAFYGHMLDYQKRLGAWGKHQASFLHRRFGHLAKGQIERTMRAMGGEERRHSRFCICNQCQDWYPVVNNRPPGDDSRALPSVVALASHP